MSWPAPRSNTTQSDEDKVIINASDAGHDHFILF